MAGSQPSLLLDNPDLPLRLAAGNLAVKRYLPTMREAEQRRPSLRLIIACSCRSKSYTGFRVGLSWSSAAPALLELNHKPFGAAARPHPASACRRRRRNRPGLDRRRP
jgi:hypothetical protein